MTTRHYARQTVAQRASALRRYFGWLGRKGTLAGDPTISLSARTGGSRLPRAAVALGAGGHPGQPAGPCSEVARRGTSPRRCRPRTALRERLARERAVRAVRGGPRPARPLGHGLGKGLQAAKGAHLGKRGPRRAEVGRRGPAGTGPGGVACGGSLPQRQGRYAWGPVTCAVYWTGGRRRRRTRMLCGIALRLICWTAAPTLELCRSSWVTQA